ncbi:IPT/TIG domain-containing protein [Gloeobacter kilaueensis]|uniref:Cell surface receptor IPT/TIG domain-containing protein n=1 Tax=Gloeobacter kilaueensis (strain ATCC BAA-2537 / CCAP 1431/1 / ULC 316 / JS1) TaxID=1183438 RepID=U5QM79_GLOK1|nr:IPT/TIG domain-containing protein [Gloeobacter kilaueensis]AGY58714.1 cell surface receptor IPT/TIG domain-containing protein [Gloeobacter kilaueensis JS1]
MGLLLGAVRLPAQAPIASFQAEALALQNTSLQALFSQIVRDARTRVLNTVATVTWPILPVEEDLSLRLRKLDAIRIPNQAFIQSNRDFSTDLIKSDTGAAQIYRWLNGTEELDPDSQDGYLKFLIENGMGTDLGEAAAVALDRQRVLEILKDYGGARLTIQVGSLQPTVLTNLVWEFTPYQGSLPGGKTYYRFGVRIVAENIGIVLDPKNGAEQTLKLTETLLADPNLPPVRLKDSTVTSRQKLRSEAIAEAAGAGQANPLLVLVNLLAPQLSERVATGPLNSERLSLITGLLVSSAGSRNLTGINVYLGDGSDPVANPGIAAGIAPSDASLYAGPSVSLGNNILVLSVGALFSGTQGEGTRFAGTASVDLSRLLFGKPDPAQSARQIDVAPQQIAGLYTSARLLAGTRLVVLKAGPALLAQLQPNPAAREVKINALSSAASVSTSIDSAGYIFFRSEQPTGTYSVRFCEPANPRNCLPAKPVELTDENRDQVLTLLPAAQTGGGTIPVVPTNPPRPSAPTLSIVSFTPAQGTPGAGFVTVATAGPALVRGTQVFFGGVPAPRVTIVRRTQLTADIPIGARSGPIEVRLPSGASTFSSTRFEVLATRPPIVPPPPVPVEGPQIVSIVPTHGVAGETSVTITVAGENLRRGTQVFFNGKAATGVNIVRRTELTADVPPDARSGPIEIILPSGRKLRSTVNFTVER